MSETGVVEKSEISGPSAPKWNLNEVKLVGRLSKDPVEHTFDNESKVVNLSVANNRRYQDAQKEWKQKSTFVEVAVHGEAARAMALSLKKGQEVYVEGRLRQDIWEKNGKTRSQVRIDAFKLQTIVREKSKSAEMEHER